MAIITRCGSKNNKMKCSYTNEDAVEKVIHYATRTRATDNNAQAYAMGGIGVDAEDPAVMCSQFRKVQAVYRKEHYGVRVIHEIISFYPWETIDKSGYNRIEEIAYKFGACYYLSGFQVVYAVHMDTAHPHIHYVINATNFMDGYKFNYTLPERRHREEYLDRVMADCLGYRVVWHWVQEEDWAPVYYEELNPSCEHSGFLIS